MLRSFWKALCHLCFPVSCFHCKETHLHEDHILCHDCSLTLDPLTKQDRCTSCFAYCPDNIACFNCMASPNPFLASAAVFDYAGPPVTLVKQLKYGRHAFLAQSMGALMAAQLIELGWPLPDILIPVPMSATHYLGRGFNQSELLATQLGTMINRPTHSALGRLSGDYSQAGLTKFQRATLSKKRMQLLLSNELKGKTLLVIDDVMTTGQTLRCCAEILQQALPKAVYALTFCLAR